MYEWPYVRVHSWNDNEEGGSKVVCDSSDLSCNAVDVVRCSFLAALSAEFETWT